MLALKDPALLASHCYVNGEWVAADSHATFEVHNPASGELLATLPALGAAETERALQASQNALPGWAAKPAKERAQLLRRLFDLIMASQDDLALLLTSEQGKPLAEAKGEIAYGAAYFEWYGEEAKRIYGDTIPAAQSDRHLLVFKEPIGVCAAITPWNFPNAMITRKAAAALAAGCPIVVRPASQTPLSALALAVLAERAGIPRGVFSVITGPAQEIGRVFTGSDIVKKLSFTGSTEVGRQLMAQSAPTIKKLSLELGGNAPFIVFDDADLDAAVEGAMICKYRNSGQTCVCANRIYVQDGIYEAFAEKFAAAVAKLKVGNGVEPGVQQGPLIDMHAVEKVEAHIADALAKGGRLVTGGKRHALGGTFFEPTVIAEASNSMLLARVETFGPVAPLFRFHDEAEAVALANDTEFGLAAYFYARDVGRIFRVAHGLEYGMVGVNTGILSNEAAPFGGVKQSGLGREGSKYGIEDYLEIKYVCLAGLNQ
jgi:succinate-semialdehyde dehydrogenase/glutarate-semialdehyde dehydrogenase